MSDLVQRLRNCNRADEAMGLLKEAADALEGKQENKSAGGVAGVMTTESAAPISKTVSATGKSSGQGTA